MAAVTSDLKARERSAELRQLVGKKYRYIDRKWDVMFWVTAAFVALWLDYVLLKTKSFVLTSVIGGMGFAFILWFTNYVMLSPFLQPVSFMGHTLTVADGQGIQYLRSQTPEYLRLVQQGSLRTFLGETLYVSLVFGATMT